MQVAPFMFVDHKYHKGSMFITRVENSQVFHSDGSMWFLDNVIASRGKMKSMWNFMIYKISSVFSKE